MADVSMVGNRDLHVEHLRQGTQEALWQVPPSDGSFSGTLLMAPHEQRRRVIFSDGDPSARAGFRGSREVLQC